MIIEKMWKRVQKMFRQRSDFERWVISKNPQNAADLELLYREWTYKQHREIY